MTSIVKRISAEDGTSLVEVLVATVIMAISFGAILGGFVSGILGSDLDRRHAIGETQIRSLAEYVKGASYTNCATSNAYSTGFSLQGATFDLEIEYWDGNEFVSTCAVDRGLQKVRMTVRPDSPSGNPASAETLELIKRDRSRVA